MLDRVIEFSVRNTVVVLMLVAAAAVTGVWSMRHLPLDATPDPGDIQVIVLSEWDRSPDLVEDQVTYPIVTALLGAPAVTDVRGYSEFGYSYVQVIFEDGTDLYSARARTLEYLSAVTSRLPAGVTPRLGPDATGLGWIYQYVLVDDSGTQSLSDLRSVQDWYLAYHLKSVPGVAEIASIGGYERQYQINIDPNRLRAYGVPLRQVVEAVRSSNTDVGGRLIEIGGAEYMVRGRGYAKSAEDFENIVVTSGADRAPVRVRDIASVAVGADLRRGVADLDGRGDVVSGIVVMRQGQNALEVIDRVKNRLAEIAPGLPPGVRVVGIYDRSALIQRAIGTLTATVLEVMGTVALIVLLFLWHVPSAIIPIITIPLSVLISFSAFRWLGLSANIMSLSGIAIAVGTLVDAAIVVVEQTHKKLEEWQRSGSPGTASLVVIEAVKEVAPTSFFALIVIAVSFLPVLTLEAQEGRIFKPLAYTKTLAMLVGAVLVITLDPALRVLFTRVRRVSFRPAWLATLTNAIAVGRIREELHHPVSRRLLRAYEPVVRWSLRWRWAVIGGAIALAVATLPVYSRLGAEFMPPLDEGALLYMPSSLPGISVSEAQRLLTESDRILKTFPEVDRVLGKAGRAESATDPAPLSMFETVITLKPTSEWRRRPTWYSSWAPSWSLPMLRHFTPDHISTPQLVAELDRAVRFPGMSNAWTMPIRGRVDMLTSGIRTPVGIKVTGPDAGAIESLASRVEEALRAVPGTRSVFAERAGSGFFLDVDWNRERLARYGIALDDAQMAIENAIGGQNVTTTVEGRRRYSVNVRYLRDFRDTAKAIEQVLVPGAAGGNVALSELANVKAATGPAMVRTENGLLTGFVYVDIQDRDPDTYMQEASRVLSSRVTVPPGSALLWSGQFESMRRVSQRLRTVVPATLFLVVLLLYLSTRSIARTAIVCLAVPFSAIGAVWLMFVLGYHMSVAAWVGLIALVGIDAETGMFMLLYLDLAYEKAKREGRLQSLAALREVIVEGAARRIRPKCMTVATTMLGLVPIMWATGTGADVMKRIAAPMIGGLVTSFMLELLVYPALYELWRSRGSAWMSGTQVPRELAGRMTDAPTPIVGIP